MNIEHEVKKLADDGFIKFKDKLISYEKKLEI